jgi:protein-histidine pros-kinase
VPVHGQDGTLPPRVAGTEAGIQTAIDDALLERNPDALVVTGADGRVLRWTAGAGATFGYAEPAALGHGLRDLIGIEDRAPDWERVVATARRHGTARAETVAKRADGMLLHIDIIARWLHDVPAAAILWCIRDVTEPKLRRAALQLKVRFGDLLESTPDGMLLVDETGHILLANGHAESLFGYGRGEMHGQPVDSLVPPRFRTDPSGLRDAAADSRPMRATALGVELHGRRRSGEEFPVEVSLSPLRTDEGPVVINAVRDVSERIAAARRFRALLEAAPDAIVITDGEGRIVLANSQADALFGYRREEMIGHGIELLLPERFRQAHVRHRRGFAAEPRVRAMGAGLELFARHKDGREIPVEISLSPLTTQEGMLVSAAIRDITERKQVERRLQEQNVELARASAAKTTFLAGMSHELRTPLNAILGFTGTLLMRLPGPLNGEQEKQLRTVQLAGQHLLALIDDLLDMSRIESGQAYLEPATVDCSEVAEEAVAQLQAQARSKGLDLSLELPAGPCEIQTDRRALRQILLNLVSNAVKYTDQGRVRVRLQADSPEPGSVRFTVEDTGIGIRPEDEPRLFTGFGQLNSGRESRPGAGLGLYLSARLAVLLGGRIEFHSQCEVGSVFTLTLPGG